MSYIHIFLHCTTCTYLVFLGVGVFPMTPGGNALCVGSAVPTLPGAPSIFNPGHAEKGRTAEKMVTQIWTAKYIWRTPEMARMSQTGKVARVWLVEPSFARANMTQTGSFWYGEAISLQTWVGSCLGIERKHQAKLGFIFKPVWKGLNASSCWRQTLVHSQPTLLHFWDGHGPVMYGPVMPRLNLQKKYFFVCWIRHFLARLDPVQVQPQHLHCWFHPWNISQMLWLSNISLQQSKPFGAGRVVRFCIICTRTIWKLHGANSNGCEPTQLMQLPLAAPTPLVQVITVALCHGIFSISGLKRW